MEEIRKEADCLVESTEENFGSGRCAKVRRKLWDLLEQPTSSTMARVSGGGGLAEWIHDVAATVA